MGKTLKRQRARQLKEQQQQEQQHAGGKTGIKLSLPGMPPLNASSSSSKYTFVVSACMQAQNWLGALQTLRAMAALHKVPKLGAVQRWVREADQAGDESVTARLIDAVLRCTMPPGQPAAAAAGGGGGGGGSDGSVQQSTAEDLRQGSVKRHPPWSPAAAGAGGAAAAAGAAGSSSSTDGPAGTNAQDQQQQQGRHADYAALLFKVPLKPGAGGPAAIHALPPNTVQWEQRRPPVMVVPVPFVPGAVLLQDVLSDWECEQIMAAAEAIGYSLDVDYTFGGAAGDDGLAAAAADAGAPSAAAAATDAGAAAAKEPAGEDAEEVAAAAAAANGSSGATKAAAATSVAPTDAAVSESAAAAAAAADAAAKSAARAVAAAAAGLPAAAGGPAAGCVWLADPSLNDAVYERVRELLPQQLDGGALAGINARWRLYRYTPGNVYRPHVDGAWPGSGVDPVTGEYVFDAYGDRWSRLTFLVYLNDGFQGGHTTFYTPSAEQEGQLDARGVLPRRGCVLVFPHGGTVGSLVHEGSAVLAGSKYVIRTDVLYMKTDTGRQQQLKEVQQQQLPAKRARQ